MHAIELKLALVGLAGILAQWISWRFSLPAIALLLLTGLAAGPLTGMIDPVRDFGEVYRPVISLAVAIILFEGGLTLNLKEISETSKAVRRIILVGGPLVWLFSTLAAHYAGGLSWQAAILLGAILVVTGPTVIMPLLRQARLKKRAASLLRWEAIVNDPIGALLAVLSFEIFLVANNVHEAENLLFNGVIAALIALPGAWLFSKFIVWLFLRGHIAEYLKAPFLLVAALIANAVTNLFLEEAGLLTVTVMGIILANSRIASLAEMKRFKETITVLLVSGVFILLTASLDLNLIYELGWQAAAFVAAILFIARPVAITIATMGTGLTWQERLLTAWIAPRGVVAVAIAGIFGTALAEQGIADGEKMIAYTFAVVAATILLHGFSLPLLARLLNLRAVAKPGILVVGGSPWSIALAEKLKACDVPVMIADGNWNHLGRARAQSIPTYFGDVLSEHAHHELDIGVWSSLIAASDNDAYNALVCTEFGPEVGRGNVLQIGDRESVSEKRELHFTLGGRALMRPGMSYDEMNDKIASGWQITSSTLSKEFNYEAFLSSRPEESQTLFWFKPGGVFHFAASNPDAAPGGDTIVISFGPPRDRSRKARPTNGQASGKASGKANGQEDRDAK
ncbi:cation:proton antiporter [Salaquimonas pukyongi]|uniref:cation:proton antiporter n=1 Tax=Salaquimonas pukyongi TaxID=2712698 RepID=UPI00096BA9D5|nr:sodium:proton antiporter [Salaquimonas pukyongi]